MPEYLAPGVFIEEVSFRTKSIEGVGTSTTGMVGPSRYGPISGEPELLTSFADFERVFGGLDQLTFGSNTTDNYLAHAVRAYFEEGGKRLYVSRVYGGTGGAAITDNDDFESPALAEVTLTGRFPGKAGDMRITFVPQRSDNLLVEDPLTDKLAIRRVQDNDTVLVDDGSSPPDVALYDFKRFDDKVQLTNAAGDVLEIDSAGKLWRTDSGSPPEEILEAEWSLYEIYLLTVDVVIERPIIRPKRPNDRYTIPEVLAGFSFHPKHANALTSYFAATPTSRRLALTVPFAIGTAPGVDTGAEIAVALLGNDVVDALTDDTAKAEKKQRIYSMSGGSDGSLPTADSYKGTETNGIKSGLMAFEDLEDISIVAAPGYSAGYDTDNSSRSRGSTIQAHLINHCHKMRYRVAVLDAPDDNVLSQVRNYRSKIDSTHAALYYPWVRILDPITEEEINLPPSGFVSGIFARNDVENGVHKAPANEIVRLSIGFEFMLSKAQQEALNPEGVNCFRFFEGRGYRLWGARTVSSDPEWKYVNVRRYFAYLEHSIDRGTQWAVFENNNEPLWANIRRTVEDFLFNEWKSGRLMGEKPEEAYFVRCDRSTMTQNDLDNGRLICLIGVAPVKPAEFVIFRIGQWTADRRG